jgi:branched-chain amino acid transport system ATP-binding protein
MAALLEIAGIEKHFSGLQALQDISFEVDEGGVFGIMGANGAGKTTLFNIIAGALKPDGGAVRFRGADVTGRRPSKLCAAGIARTFQIAKPFPELTVLEAVRVGAFIRERRTAAATRRARAVVERFGLGAKADSLGRHLTVLERKRLELARAYATEPKVLLLDEVAAGLRPAEVEDLVAIVQSIVEEGITVLMIEHVLPAIFALARHVVVLDHGRMIADGTPDEIAANHTVIEAYLGAGYAPA